MIHQFLRLCGIDDDISGRVSSISVHISNHFILQIAKPDALSILQFKTLVGFWQILRGIALKSG